MLGGPFIFVMDKRKKVLGYSDIYPAGVKVPEGEITILAYLRHPSAKLLQTFAALTLTIDRTLAKPIKLKVFSSPGSIVAAQPELPKQPMVRGATLALFVAEPEFSTLPKTVKAGDVLQGTIQCVTTHVLTPTPAYVPSVILLNQVKALEEGVIQAIRTSSSPLRADQLGTHLVYSRALSGFYADVCFSQKCTGTHTLGVRSSAMAIGQADTRSRTLHPQRRRKRQRSGLPLLLNQGVIPKSWRPPSKS